VQLCQQIKSCDEILERMENLLSGFQADLRAYLARVRVKPPLLHMIHRLTECAIG